MGFLSLLGPILPYILGVLGVVGTYFAIKWKGASEEKAKIQAAQAQATAKINQQVTQAVSQDAKIDQKVAAEVKVIEEKHENAPVDAPGKFTF